MKKNVRWIAIIIILEVILTLFMHWNSTFPIAINNPLFLFVLIPILLICISFLIFFLLTFHNNDLSESILVAVFERNRISLIIFSIIDLFLFLCSVIFFILADLLEPEIYSIFLPYAILGFILFWEIIVLFSYTREEFKEKPKFWIYLPLLLAGNYFFWHTLVKVGRYLEPYYLTVYPKKAEYVFSNYQWWQFLLPIREFGGFWVFGNVLTHYMGNIIGIAGVWYLYQTILMLTAFFLSWKVFRSDILSYSLAIFLVLGTHHYHAFQYSSIAGLYLLQTLFILLLYFAYEFIRNEKKNNRYLFALIPTLLLTAIFEEGWLDFFASVWAISIFLFLYFRSKKQTQYIKRLIIIFIIFNIIASIYIYMKLTYIGFHHASGESAVVFAYSNEYIWRAVEDLISNYITHLYMTLTNFLPPALITSNALYKYSAFLKQQHNLVLGQYIFFWRYAAGVLTTLFYVFFINVVKQVFKEKPFSSFFPLVLFMIMVAVNSPTHTIVQIRPMKAMPVLGYYVQQGVLGFSLCIAYLFHQLKLRILNSTSKCNFESVREVSCGKMSTTPTAKSKEHSWEHTHSLPKHKDTRYPRY